MLRGCVQERVTQETKGRGPRRRDTVHSGLSQQKGRERRDGRRLWEGLENGSFFITFLSTRFVITLETSKALSPSQRKIAQDNGFSKCATQTDSIGIT